MGRVFFINICFVSVVFQAQAEVQRVQIDEVLCGANGDSTIQFIELKFDGPGHNRWGPQSGETEGRARLVFFDARGTQTAEYVFPSDPPLGPDEPLNGGISVLVATQAFADMAGMPVPDFIIPASLFAGGAKVCFTGNPDNANAVEVNLCLSYGNFAGDTELDTEGQPAGPPTASLPITHASSIQRHQNFGNYGTGQFNADFSLASPTPRESGGALGTMTVAPNVDQGQTLFFRETFLGNGRTCLTCHKPENDFALAPDLIATLPADDPLFVAEFNPELSELEDPCLMRSSRGLILENIDGFENPPVFRASPPLMNVSLTAPYGQSGEFSTLRDFATVAVKQHLPRTLNRNADPALGEIDFRLPTEDELALLEDYMQSLSRPADGNFDIERLIDAAVARGGDRVRIEAGRNVFFGTGKCSLCHTGPVLADADVSLGGGNRNFDTGVVDSDSNQFIDCLGGPLPPESGGGREFNTPQLLGIGQTGPFFHDHSADTLLQVVNFYRGFEFTFSPGGQVVGTIVLNGTQADQLVGFMEALVEPIRVRNLTAGTGFFTIQSAIDAAAEGDVIQADPGIYTETLDFLGKDITVRSLDPHNAGVVAGTMINGGGEGTCVTLSAGQISGFTIQNGTSSSDLGAGVYASGDSIVTHNVIKANSSFGDGPGGVEARDAAQIVNNKISDNFAEVLGGAVRVRDNAVVRNNTMVGNSTVGTGASVHAENASVVTHNIVSFSAEGLGIRSVDATPTLDFNCVFGNADGDYGNPEAIGPNDIDDDPLLDLDGIHLTGGSPCVDAGDPSFLPTPDEKDLDGGSRHRGASIDIGADERPDCNNNGVDDFFDLSGDAGHDCDADGIPDECALDSDGDGRIDGCDGCPADPSKTKPGLCGCGITDTDGDDDGAVDCLDLCPADPGKVDPGACGCGVSDDDTDGDGTADCNDLCPDDPAKVDPLVCGCGVPDDDADMDEIPDCIDVCNGDETYLRQCGIRPSDGSVNIRAGVMGAIPGMTVTFRLDGDPGTDKVRPVNTAGRAAVFFLDVGEGEHTIEILECDLIDTLCD